VSLAFDHCNLRAFFWNASGSLAVKAPGDRHLNFFVPPFTSLEARASATAESDVRPASPDAFTKSTNGVENSHQASTASPVASAIFDTAIGPTGYIFERGLGSDNAFVASQTIRDGTQIPAAASADGPKYARSWTTAALSDNLTPSVTTALFANETRPTVDDLSEEVSTRVYPGGWFGAALVLFASRDFTSAGSASLVVNVFRCDYFIVATASVATTNGSA